jgi:NlpC/P60 family putative phage cell wall peptidase
MSRTVAVARAWLGTPYVHQASVRGAGADCLGLVRGVWREIVGDEPEMPPPYTQDWGETGAHEVLRAAALRWLRPVDAPQAGDVVLFRMRDAGIAKHLGILSAAGAMPRFIHAYSGHGVVESPLSDPWARRIVGAFRFPFEE